MRVQAVTPIGTRKTSGFATTARGCSVQTWDQPVYPEEPRGPELRALRMAAGLSLRGLANTLQVTALELSGLERGSHTLSEADWSRVLNYLRTAASLIA